MCAVAVAAMAVGKGLRYVLARIPTIRHQDGQRHPRTRDLLAFLGSHGIFAGMICDVTGRLDETTRLQFDCPLKGRPAILSVPSTVFKESWHYVFWDGKNVRDPCPSASSLATLADYQVFEVIPLTYIDERPVKHFKS